MYRKIGKHCKGLGKKVIVSNDKYRKAKIRYKLSVGEVSEEDYDEMGKNVEMLKKQFKIAYYNFLRCEGIKKE